jgi:hypothetical protein
MGHIHGLTAENFKIFFEKQEFSFAPITVFTGTNGAGKSTVSDILKFLNSIFQKNLINNGDGEIYNIDIDKIISPINKEKLDPKIDEFINLYNNKSNKEEDSIKLSIPTNIPSCPKNLQIKVEFKTFSYGIKDLYIEKIGIYELDTEIIIFEIVKNNDGYYSKINFEYFYEIDSKNFNAAIEIEEILALYGINTLDQLNTQESVKSAISRKLKEIFGNNNVEILIPDNDGIVILYDINGDSENNQVEAEKSKDYNCNVFNYKESVLKINKKTISYAYPSNLHKLLTTPIIDFSKIFDTDEELNIHKELIKQKYYQKFNKNLPYPASLNQLILNYLTENKFLITDHDIRGEMIFRPEKNIINKISRQIEIVLDEVFDIKIENSKKMEFVNQEFEKYFQDSIWNKIMKSFRDYFDFTSIHYVSNRNTNIASNRSIVKNSHKDFYNDIELFKNLTLHNDVEILEFFKVWVKRFNIAEDVDISLIESGVCTIKLKKGNKLFNIADEGLGSSRILQLLIKICSIAEEDKIYRQTSNSDSSFFSKIILLEEPETGLHPAFQSKLASLLIDAFHKFNIQFIVDSHSEYMIRSFQVNVVKEYISPDEIQIYYLYHPDLIPEGELQSYPINICKDGALTKNFGSGFFDENAILNIALYSYLKNNKN